MHHPGVPVNLIICVCDKRLCISIAMVTHCKNMGESESEVKQVYFFCFLENRVAPTSPGCWTQRCTPLGTSSCRLKLWTHWEVPLETINLLPTCKAVLLFSQISKKNDTPKLPWFKALRNKITPLGVTRNMANRPLPQSKPENQGTHCTAAAGNTSKKYLSNQ